MKRGIIIIMSVVQLFSCQTNERSKTNDMKYGNKVQALKAKAEKYYQADNYKKAYEAFDSIIAIDTANGEVFYKRGYCQAQMSDFLNSTEDYLKAIKLGYRVDDAYFNIGCNYAASFNDSLALHYFEKTLQVNPKYEEAKEQVSYFRERLGVSEI